MIIQTGDIATRVDISGPQDAPALVLMHSLGTSAAIWTDVARQLARSFRVICPDFRGHGGTSVTPGPYTMATLAADICCLCEALHIGKAHIGGLSIGGMVAQQLAIHRPDLVASLILCDTALRMVPPEMWHERAAKVREHGVASLGDGVVDRWITPSFAQTKDGQRLRDILFATDPEGYAGATEAIATADFTTTASSIKVPTLVVVGEDDQATPVPLAEALRNAIGGARLHVIPATRHIPSIEQPLHVADALQDFLASRDVALTMRARH